MTGMVERKGSDFRQNTSGPPTDAMRAIRTSGIAARPITNSCGLAISGHRHRAADVQVLGERIAAHHHGEADQQFDRIIVDRLHREIADIADHQAKSSAANGLHE